MLTRWFSEIVEEKRVLIACQGERGWKLAAQAGAWRQPRGKDVSAVRSIPSSKYDSCAVERRDSVDDSGNPPIKPEK